ncbi:MAG: hypothetical protein MJ179_06875 [Treponema sp.]|nr:hypothetical protein [Treponema sp.]
MQDFTAKWCNFKLIHTSIFICTIDYIEGHMEGQEQTVYTFTKEGGVGNSSLHGKYSDCIFIGWGEFEF